MQRMRLYLTAIVLSLFCLLSSSGYSQAIDPHYDTIYTGPAGSEFVALAVSNFGEIGQAGAGGVNMDFTACGLECGTRHADSVYLYSASPFLLEADDTHTNISIACSYGQTTPSKPYAWTPVAFDTAAIRHSLGCAIQNVKICGKFVSPDGHFGAELFQVNPVNRSYSSTAITFLTRVYPVDGLDHPHVTVGWVENWNVPSDRIDSNLSRTYEYGEMLYLQGSDTAGGSSCLANDSRFATSTILWAFSGNPTQSNMCGGNIQQERTVVGSANLLEDVAGPGFPQPDRAAWWNMIAANEGRHIADSTGDLAVWNTAVYDYTVNRSDTVYFWTVLASSYSSSSDDMFSTRTSGVTAITSYAIDCYASGCGGGMVGDANGLGGEIPTIGDISTLIDANFISGNCASISCLDEADINRSGGCNPTCGDITIGDIAMLIDYLFITGHPPMDLPCTCWW